MSEEELEKQITAHLTEYADKSIPELIKKLLYLFGGGTGSGQFHQVQSIIAVKTAQLVNKQLADTACSISDSANRIKETLDKASRDTGERVSSVGSEVVKLTASLAQAAQKIEAAGNQSAAAAKRLNQFTLLLGVGTLLLFGAACWQAYETGRQANIAAKQIIAPSQPQSLPPKQQPKVATPPMLIKK